MATSSFEVEDQTDEDFFDKLINDDTDYTGYVHNSVENNEFDELKAFSKLSLSEVGPAGVDTSGNASFGVNGELGHEHGVGLESLDPHKDAVVVKESESSIPNYRSEGSALEGKAGNGNEAIALEDKGQEGPVDGTEGAIALEDKGEEGAVDGTEGKSIGSVGTGVKVVQWSSFNSDLNPSDGTGFGLHSDFYSNFGDNSGDPFANLGNTDISGAESNVTNGVLENSVADLGASVYGQHQEGQFYGVTEEHNLDGQGLNGSQNWENLYPGWRYDPNTEQWYQLEGYDGNENANAGVNMNANSQESLNVNFQSPDNADFSDQKADAYYLPQEVHSVAQSMAEGSAATTISNWNHHSSGNTEYPARMIFDPQYPGWYYDTIAQEWRQLESSTPAFDESTSVDHNLQYHNTNVENHGSQSLVVQQSVANWGGSMSTYDQQNAGMLHAQKVANSDTFGFTEKQQSANHYFSTEHVINSVNQQTGFNPSGSIPLDDHSSRGYGSGVGGFESFNHVQNFSQHQNQAKEPNQVMHFSSAQFHSQKPVHFPQQSLQNGTQFSHEAREGRSSAGRPPHALITFGFGGKLIVMKDNSSTHANLTYGSQDSVGGVINVLNLMEVVNKTDAANFGIGGYDYFHALCQQSFTSPLVGGNVGSKELNKWIDDKIANCETPYMDSRKEDHLRLLFSLLKIACQYYGKLRSPFGTDQALKEIDSPGSAVAKLFASAKRSSEYGALIPCLQNLPSEAQFQATALEVQKLLVSGRKKEALECAQEGQLWGPALVIASQLGDQFYGDTVKHMALNQLVAGSPLRTLCLLIAGQPADVFSNDTTNGSLPSFINVSQQHAQIGANYMLDEWEENLAILTANRTKDDELVLIHLGDCLWKDRGQTTAAHICYLVAEANFEPYADSARLCLIGADHWKFPRTYASPEAIQRTELYEYSRVLGNSQFLLLPFQPYKVIYAHMLAEVGKVADALKYCQAILKSLQTGRAPEVDKWRQSVSSLEERIRAHQQGGYSTNSAPNKLMGKLLTLIDSTAHRVVGALPPPVPSTSQGLSQSNEHALQPRDPIVPNSQSTMAMSSLMPSASMEPVSEWTAGSNQLSMPIRSISEPEFGRSPTKVDSSKKVHSSKTQEKAPAASGSSRIGRFGTQFFQKTLGLVVRSRPDRQAKLGETNKFYYDEKLKRWVEEGAEPPAEEAALPPPPTTAAVQNRMQDYNINDALKTNSFLAVAGGEIKSPVSSEQSSGIPPIPPSSNQFSARGRMGVRSRYVDTFNKGGGTPGNLFQSPSLPAAKPGGGFNPKIFIPAPVTSFEETVQTPVEVTQEPSVSSINPPMSFKDAISTPRTSTSSSMTMHRFPSMDNIVQKRAGEIANGNSFVPPNSRRVASCGSLSDGSNPSMRHEIKPLGGPLSMSRLSSMPSEPPSIQFSSSGGSLGDDLQEVEL